MPVPSSRSTTPTDTASPGFLTDTPDGVVPGQLAGLELRHRQHARVEDRIRQAKATGLRKLPFHSFQAAPGSNHHGGNRSDRLGQTHRLRRPSRPGTL
jgi:hypothetical protein